MPRHAALLLSSRPPAVDDHPLVRDVNAEHKAALSPVERTCKAIADATGAPLALFLAVAVQVAWVTVGVATHWDPYPFPFLLTCSNILQLILIFIIAVAQKQSSEHAELRAEADHDAIARLLHHQEVQEEFLVRIATQTQADVEDLKAAVEMLVRPAA
ncbi:MAG: DUF1003 domain-containing protein [Candidatus Eremiobacteraeota bacterium]|nr:DUF1003 domain-containing protein [Candidatus Eremiobacteraeota bacterium]MBC5827447.1 DUF1003 domain-containing protein [Candidatus Eremiobacteraeota bacterium]